ncbi:MAG: GNAT family N-acetyltransferase [Bacteroidota bacterium]
MNHWLNPIQLSGKHLTLIQLERGHKSALVEAANDGELWKLWYTSVPSEETIEAYVEKALADERQRTALPFVVYDNHTGRIIGSTRYCNAVAEHRRLDIGYTWYAKRYQRTAINTECKYLLLQYAFEQLDAIAVQFMTNWFNFKSRKAILRLGAKQDGVIRNHRIDKDGCLKDTVIFSIIRDEWKLVKKSLGFQLQQHPNSKPTDPVYETERLFIRPTIVEDATFLHELMNSEGWLQFIGDRGIRTVADAEKYILERMRPQQARLGYSNHTVIRKSDGAKMGGCGLYDREGLEGVDIGFSFLPQYSGQGYAYESAAKMKDLAFNEFGLSQIKAITVKENIRSQKLIEKLGLRFLEMVRLPGDAEEVMLYRL